MIYSQTDSQGFYIGQVAFDVLEDQPAGAIDVPAPNFDTATEKAKWDGTDWVVKTILQWAEGDKPTPEQIAEQDRQQRISEIKSELDRLDREAIRPLRAINAGTDTEYDRTRLADLDAEAETLRQELASL